MEKTDGSIYHRTYARGCFCPGPYMETIPGRYKLAATLDGGGLIHGTAVEFDEDESIYLVYYNNGKCTGQHRKGT